MKAQETYIHSKTIKFPGMVARIFSPVLTEDERARRMQAIQRAAASLLMKK